MSALPSESEVLGWFDSLSNWGRWGPDDQRGTLNLITPEVRRRAAQLVREGTSVSCSWDIEPRGDGRVHRFMNHTGEGLDDQHRVRGRRNAFHDGKGDRGAWADESLLLHTHNRTHVDALCHMFWDGQMYNGKPAEHVTAELGATANDVTAASDGAFTRGVLVDVPVIRGIDWLQPGEGVLPEDLEAAEDRMGFRIEPGDALLVRTGYGRRVREQGDRPYERHGQAGIHAACLPWLHQRGVAVTACDTAHDVMPSGYEVMPLPVHYIGIAAMGLWTIDSCDLEQVTRTCSLLGRWEFLFTFQPLRVIGGTASPVNPIATF